MLPRHFDLVIKLVMGKFIPHQASTGEQINHSKDWKSMELKPTQTLGSLAENRLFLLAKGKENSVCLVQAALQSLFTAYILLTSPICSELLFWLQSWLCFASSYHIFPKFGNLVGKSCVGALAVVFYLFIPWYSTDWGSCPGTFCLMVT